MLVSISLFSLILSPTHSIIARPPSFPLFDRMNQSDNEKGNEQSNRNKYRNRSLTLSLIASPLSQMDSQASTQFPQRK